MVIAPDDPRLDRVGFAKLLGDGVEVYAKKTEIIIGRQSKSTNLDVVLGENMNVSRQHARIAYNSARGVWELHVLGKNGVTVHGTLHTPGSPPVVLNSQDNIQIADRSFHFLLPSQPQWPGDAQPAAQTAARQAAPRQSFEVPQSTAALQPPAGLPGAPAAAAGMPNPMANRAVAALPPAQQQAVMQQILAMQANIQRQALLAQWQQQQQQQQQGVRDELGSAAALQLLQQQRQQQLLVAMQQQQAGQQPPATLPGGGQQEASGMPQQPSGQPME